MVISDEEKGYIRTAYRDAKDKNYQITIEAQTHATSRDHICEILGIELKVKAKEDMKRKLYNMNWNDAKIAAYLGLARHTILDWRHRRGLPQGGMVVVFIDKPKRDSILMECYNCGMSDGQSAVRAGCSKSVANAWRIRNKLPCNHHTQEYSEKEQALTHAERNNKIRLKSFKEERTNR